MSLVSRRVVSLQMHKVAPSSLIGTLGTRGLNGVELSIRHTAFGVVSSIRLRILDLARQVSPSCPRGSPTSKKVSTKHDEATLSENRSYIKSVCKALHYCSLQNVALRCHFEGGESDNRGNFLELMRLLSEFDKVTASRLAEGPRNAVYLSPQIQNSLLKSMASLIVKDIVEEVGDQPYCLLGDETRDEGGTEQLALCIRYSKLEKIGDPLVIQESFLGFISLENLDSSAIVDRLIHRLDSIALDASRCTSQGYDGASVMSGHRKGVYKVPMLSWLF